MTSADADQVADAHATPSSGGELVDQRGGQEIHLGRAQLGAEEEGQAELGERELVGQAGHLLGLQLHPVPAEVGGGGQRLGLALPQGHARPRAAAVAGSRSSPGRAG